MTKTRRGDTIIEIMFAIAVFALVAIISIVMMNAGVASGERALEVVTARSELNAQAEALRFIHSSYAAELTLPTCPAPDGGKCQQFTGLWNQIVSHSIAYDALNIPDPVENCADIYENDNQMLNNHNAFILNAREIQYVNNSSVNTGGDTRIIRYSYETDDDSNNIFQPAILGARLVYVNAGELYNEDHELDYDQSQAGSHVSSVDNMQTTNPVNYRNLARAEGIWVVAVRSQSTHLHHMTGTQVPDFYDFYIQTCWYGSNSKAPSSLDAVIRLYNPDRGY